MAEKKPEKKPEAESADKGEAKKEAKKGGLLTKLPVLLGGVMVIEAVVLFAGFKLLGGKPHAATAEVQTETEGKEGEKGEGKKGKTVELPVGEFKALNRKSGQSFLYDLSIVIIAKTANETKVSDELKAHKALIDDRIRTIIAESEPEKLDGGEPGLETLHRQLKYQLDLVVGDGLIEDVLVPRCIPFRADF